TLRARELGNGALVRESCDWWSLGAVLYEMLYGDPPFYSDTVPETYGKIMSCEKHLAFDDAVDVSDDAKDLMRQLLVRQEDRLDLAAIKAHPFFASVDWETIRAQEAPFVPRISSPDDTSNFSVGDETAEDVGMAAARASSSRLSHGREYAGEQLPFIGFTYLPLAFTQGAKRAPAQTPRGPRDDPAMMRVLRTKIEQFEAAATSTDIRWREQQAWWAAERRILEDKIKTLEAEATQPAAAQPAPPPQRRESAMQTEPEDMPAAEAATETGDAYQQLATRLIGSLEEQLGGQAEHLAQLAGAVNELAVASGAKLEQGMQAQRKELAALTQLVQACLPTPPATTPALAATATNDSPRLGSVATLSQAYHALGGTSARLSMGSTTAARGPRRSISAVDDAALGSHPKSVVATLVNETPSDTDVPGAGSADTRRQSLAAASSASRLARVERRASAGVSGDALSAVSAKCDRLTTLFERQAAELGGIQKAQASLLAVCSELRLSLPPAASGDAEDAGGSRRSRRKTEQPRRHVGGLFSAAASQDVASDSAALELLKASTDELVASLRVQLAASESARESAETRATELLGWIGRESKGRALLEDMIRTAQQACKMVEDKLEAMLKEADELRASLAAKEEEASSLAATIDTREKELRNLRRASRKALDQLSDLQTAQQQQRQQQQQESGNPSDRSLEDLDAEIKEAASVHVRLQFELSRLEGDVSRLESEKTQLAKDVAHRDRRLREAEAKLRAATAADSDGIRVRGIDNEDEDDKKFGSTGAKSHKRFKVQIQNMQKHIEYLETKLALATSENDVLRKQQKQQRQPSSSGAGTRFPGFARSGTTTVPAGSSAQPRPMSTMFPNIQTNLDAMSSTASLHTDSPSESTETAGSGLGTGASAHPRPRNDSLSASFERIRSPFKGFRKHFTSSPWAHEDNV
ncbi:Serine/threonine-protein kinase MRCK alpha, partial [Coemansia spiralis]